MLKGISNPPTRRKAAAPRPQIHTRSWGASVAFGKPEMSTPENSAVQKAYRSWWAGGRLIGKFDACAPENASRAWQTAPNTPRATASYQSAPSHEKGGSLHQAFQ